jgi:hAT family C-terminal dimerisation region
MGLNILNSEDYSEDPDLIKGRLEELGQYFLHNYCKSPRKQSTVATGEAVTTLAAQFFRPRLPSAVTRDHELDDYLKDETQVVWETDPLKWWKTIGSTRWPNVARMARDILGIPGISFSRIVSCMK